MSKRYALIERRKQLGLSQEDMARQLDVSYTTYWEIENNTKNPSVEQLAEIGGALNIGWNMLFAVMNIIDYDMDIYSKNERLKLIWIFTGEHSNRIGILRVEDSHNKWKDLSLDEFSNILYYRKVNGYEPNIIYDVQDSIDLKLWYLKDKSNSLLRWCNSNGEYGQYIINHAVLSYGITLDDFIEGSSKYKIKLRCDKGHEYEPRIEAITRSKCACPKCKANSTSYPEQFIYWSLKQIYPNCKNRYKIDGYEIDVYIQEIKTCIEYNGEQWHKDKVVQDMQKKEHMISLGYRFIVIHEHQKKGYDSFNEDEIEFYCAQEDRDCKIKELVICIVDNLLKADSKLIDFNESEKYAWEYSKGKIPYEKSIEYKCPELLEEWDPSNIIKPSEVTTGSAQYVKWRCSKCGNEWETRIYVRAYNKRGCSRCGFNIFTGEIHKFSIKNAKNSMHNALKVAPELEKEFSSELNEGSALYDYTSCSTNIVNWKCTKCNNIWNSSMSDRIHRKSGCPYCGFNVFSDSINKLCMNKEYALKVAPGLEKEFSSELNEGKILSDYTSGSNVRIHWKCTQCNHVWSTRIYHRVARKTGCPFCGYNIFTSNINKHSIRIKRTKKQTRKKKEPVLIVNGVEYYL